MPITTIEHTGTSTMSHEYGSPRNGESARIPPKIMSKLSRVITLSVSTRDYDHKLPANSTLIIPEVLSHFLSRPLNYLFMNL